MTKERWEQPHSEEKEINNLTPEEQQEAQSVLKTLARLIEKPAIKKYLEATLNVAFAPTKLMAAAVDKAFSKRPRANPHETASVNDPEN